LDKEREQLIVNDYDEEIQKAITLLGKLAREVITDPEQIRLVWLEFDEALCSCNSDLELKFQKLTNRLGITNHLARDELIRIIQDKKTDELETLSLNLRNELEKLKRHINLKDQRILSSAEACIKWDIADSTLRRRVQDFPEGTIRKFSTTWVVTEEGMNHVFGMPKPKQSLDKK
jgi:hypothetical protein